MKTRVCAQGSGGGGRERGSGFGKEMTILTPHHEPLTVTLELSAPFPGTSSPLVGACGSTVFVNGFPLPLSKSPCLTGTVGHCLPYSVLLKTIGGRHYNLHFPGKRI